MLNVKTLKWLVSSITPHLSKSEKKKSIWDIKDEWIPDKLYGVQFVVWDSKRSFLPLTIYELKVFTLLELTDQNRQPTELDPDWYSSGC